VKRINQKLAARFYGPFKIIERIGAVAYKLQLPEQSKIHPIFHVSLLKKAVGKYHVPNELPKDLEVIMDEEIYPVRVLGTRIIMKNGSSVPQSLIQWKDKTIDDVTWEDDVVIRGQFPEFNLEDKVLIEEGGIDRNVDELVGLDEGPRPKVWRVYQRKNKKGIMGNVGNRKNDYVEGNIV
jgi:hypothetical protein